MPSFSLQIKREICKLAVKDKCCASAELLGIICFGGYIENNKLIVKTSASFMVKRILFLTKFCFGFNVVSEQISRKSRYIYKVIIAEGEDVFSVLEYFKLIKNSRDMRDFISFGIDDTFVQNDCCKSAVLRGAFCSSGSCMKPEIRYHLEISSGHRKAIKNIESIMTDFELNPKIIIRNSNYVIYLKNSEQICDFLGRIGSVKPLLDFHSIKVLKEFSNNMNRAINCEFANKEKIKRAADAQIDAIYKIVNTIGLESIDENLRDVAVLRCEYPDLTLTELGKILPVELSKSGVNHRLKKILEIADRLPDKKED